MAAGRPISLDDLKAKRIVDAVAAGATRKAAAQAAGINQATLCRWMARGLKGEEPFSKFRDAVKQAEGAAENNMIAVVVAAAENGTWQAAAWWLERRRQETYALKRGAPEEHIDPAKAEDIVRRHFGKSYAELRKGGAR